MPHTLIVFKQNGCWASYNILLTPNISLENALKQLFLKIGTHYFDWNHALDQLNLTQLHCITCFNSMKFDVDYFSNSTPLLFIENRWVKTLIVSYTAKTRAADTNSTIYRLLNSLHPFRFLFFISPGSRYDNNKDNPLTCQADKKLDTSFLWKNMHQLYIFNMLDLAFHPYRRHKVWYHE